MVVDVWSAASRKHAFAVRVPREKLVEMRMDGGDWDCLWVKQSSTRRETDVKARQSGARGNVGGRGRVDTEF